MTIATRQLISGWGRYPVANAVVVRPRGMSEVAASSLEEEFASLEDADTEAEVNARLSQMSSGAPAGAGSSS